MYIFLEPAEAGDRVTSNDSSDGTYVPEQNVNDGHINLTRKLGDFSTKIIENEKEIILTAKKANENEAKILVQADRIENTVKRVGVAESHIEQQADEISLRVKTSEFGSEIRQHDRDIRVAWNKISNYAQIDDTDGLILGNESDGTYSKVGYDGRLSLQMKGKETPYHALMYTENDIDVDCDNEDDYTSYTVPLPSYFDGLDSSQFAVSVSIQKVWKNGSYIPYWFGCYGYAVSSRKIKLECMSAWKKYDDLGGKTYNGNIVVSVTVIA
ncbi:hypothetical protein [Clostridium botulinum]|uniref:hypothetical protein n=1 Tax=Clostridium botulinum TaxID=1491 RepID=UPI001C9B9454|nr:hypothetical protein [Clostridium botulinum]MBY6838859.1 hypothetical protein [Clostridium botulinum]